MEEVNRKKKELREIFDSMDVSRNNSISIRELRDYLKTEGMTEDKIKEIMKEADSDGSGTMDFDEFYTLMTTNLQTKDEDTTDDFIDVFRVFDRDSTGLIKIADVKKVMMEFETSMTEEEFNDLFLESEVKDGWMDYRLFINKMLEKS